MPQPTAFHGRLKGRAAIVTGAGSSGPGFGCGKAIAFLFAREGASVLLVDIEKARAEETRALILDAGGVAQVIVADVTDSAGAARIAAACESHFGGCDILVNNVGVGAGGNRLETVDEADWRRSMDLNFSSAFQMSRAVIPLLLQRKGAAIVNIASVAGWRAHGSAAYGPAKAALLQLNRELALMYGSEGLRANAVVPGHLLTPMVESHLSEAAKDVRRRIAPLGIDGDAWDVAQAALFLAGPESRFITGAALAVDGGVSGIGPLAAWERVSNPLSTI